MSQIVGKSQLLLGHQSHQYSIGHYQVRTEELYLVKR